MARQLAVSLLLLSAGFAAAEEDGALRGSTRRLFQWASDAGYIWGRCDNWTSWATGCALNGTSMCSNRLSEGPKDATIEMVLGGLPASTAETEVHLQWWSGRQSTQTYSPLESPVGSTVFWWMADAYPQHDDEEFNGGNVRINETGHAVIKVRAPATYRVANWIAFPHVHLRVCTGDKYAHATPDTVYFTFDGPMVHTGNVDVFNTHVVSHRAWTLAEVTGTLSFNVQGATEEQVLSSVSTALEQALNFTMKEITVTQESDSGRRLADGQWTVSYSAQVPAQEADARLARASELRGDSTAFASELLTQLVAAGGDEATLAATFEFEEFGEIVYVTTTTSTTATATTTSSTTATATTTSTTATTVTGTITTTEELRPTTTSFEIITTSQTVMGTLTSTRDPNAVVDLRMQSALDILDLDALEFSPVYHCLLDGHFFDFFASGCRETCPDHADVHVGQCVRRNASDAHVSLSAAWQLQVTCGVHCVHQKIKGTLHHVRIAVGDHLNIPFQEIGVRLTFPTSEARRLQAGSAETMYLTVSVLSRRVAADPDQALLRSFLTDAEGSAWLLGLNVQDMDLIDPEHVPKDSDVGAAGTENFRADVDTDEYAPAYDEVSPSPPSWAGAAGAGGGLIPGSEYLPQEAIIGIAGGVLFVGAFLSVYTWRRRRQARHQALTEVVGKDAVGKDITNPCKADAFEEPVKPASAAAATTGRDNSPTSTTMGLAVGSPVTPFEVEPGEAASKIRGL